MANEWGERLLGELTENFDGRRVPVKEVDRNPGPYPYYGASGIVDFVDKYLFDGEYLLIAEDGENLRSRNTPVAFLARGKFWVNNHAHIVRGNDKADTRFLMYALSHADIGGYLTGSTMPKLTQGNLNRIPVQVPLLPEQRAIALVLGSLDDKIELNRDMTGTLETMARTLFTSWFVEFGPVRAKVEGRDTGLPRRIGELFPSAFDDSDLGEIPKGWRLGAFREVVEISRDQVNPMESPTARFSHFSIPAFDDGRWPKYEEGADIKSLKFRVDSGAVLLSKLNPEIERVWLVDVAPHELAICSTEFLVLRPLEPFTSSYSYCLTRSPVFRQQIEGLVTGTSKSHQRAQADSVLGLSVVVPPPPVVKAFESYAAEWLARAWTARRESHALTALRDTLLPKLISGEVRVTEKLRRAGGEAA
jgi:type I restriction enzyme S subunit